MESGRALQVEGVEIVEGSEAAGLQETPGDRHQRVRKDEAEGTQIQVSGVGTSC